MKTATRQPAKTMDADLKTFRVILQPSHWIPNTSVIVAGCKDAADARKQLHDELDRLIQTIEPGR